MKIELTFNELNEIIKARSDKDIQLGFISADTCSVATTMPMPVINRPMSVKFNLTIENVEGANAYIRLGGMPGIEMMAGAAISMLQGNAAGLAKGIPAGFIEKGEGGQFILHLDKSEKMQKIFANIDLQGITFSSESLVIAGAMNN
ncbi:MAG: hypothetical protein Q4F34_09340 [Prevotellaceae bacterium]|nr:hypothetical protein [Prevotellaceae bacterium]